MKKLVAAILLFDLMAGLLFLGVWEEGRLGGQFTLAKTAGDAVAGGDVKVLNNMTATVNPAEENIKKIALTFDDGPHPYYTEELLDGLRERGVVATFFVTGEHAALHPDVIKRMQEEGNLIGNHTYSHMQLTKKNREKFKEELIRTNEVLEEITGVEVEYVQPPYGCWDYRSIPAALRGNR